MALVASVPATVLRQPLVWAATALRQPLVWDDSRKIRPTAVENRLLCRPLLRMVRAARWWQAWHRSACDDQPPAAAAAAASAARHSSPQSADSRAVPGVAQASHRLPGNVRSPARAGTRLAPPRSHAPARAGTSLAPPRSHAPAMAAGQGVLRPSLR